VLLQPEGSTYWTEWMSFVRVHLVERALASPEDLSLFELANSIEEAIAIIERFYANYHSARYVGERLIIRLVRAPSKQQLVRLNADFRDVLARGRIEPAGVTAEEARDGDCVDLARIALYPTSNFGRIRELIDAINAL
jgi:hypothetical protein